MIKFTTVLGLDLRHLDQLKLAWPNWVEKKPGLLDQPLLVFVDSDSGISFQEVYNLVSHRKLTVCQWPPLGVSYPAGKGKWDERQRYKMLAGFVHAPAQYVRTPYWLKLDLDTVATGQPDWVDASWFQGGPAIIAHPWGYTKPPEQMLKLDEWASQHNEVVGDVFTQPALHLVPKSPESGLVKHRRIISWCGFFSTAFTKSAAQIAEQTTSRGLLPVPSQDGYLWYCAARMGLPIRRVNMKSRGWEHKSTLRGMLESIEKMKAETHG